MERAIAVYRSPEFAHIPQTEREAWAMATLIQLDLSRLVFAMDECKTSVARLRWMANLIAHLFEAKRYYQGWGKDCLLDIAESKRCGRNALKERFGELMKRHRISDVERYADYRNKMSSHYDQNALEYLHVFEKEDAQIFFGIIESFVHFSADWVQLTKDLIRDLIEPSQA
jgi:hypothetical protein